MGTDGWRIEENAFVLFSENEESRAKDGRKKQENESYRTTLLENEELRSKDSRERK